MTLCCKEEEKQYKLAQLPFAQRINRVLDSIWFLPVVSALALLGNLFALEMVLYAFCGIVMLYLGLFGTDFRLLISMFINCYIAPAMINNPGKNAESIFALDRGGAWILAFAAIALVSYVVRCLLDREIGFARLAKARPKLLWGMLALGGAYLLSGIGSVGYTSVAAKNIGFAVLQFIGVAVPYLLIGIGVRWERIDRRYLAMVGLLMGLTVGLEVIHVYVIGDVIVEGGAVARSNIYTGWGNYNNMGVLIAMAIPFAFYFIYKGQCVLLNSFLSALLCAFAFLSCSRAGIIAACGIYVFCAGVVVLKTKKKSARLSVLIGLGVAACALLAAFFAARDALDAAFATGLQSSARIDLYKLGLKVFAHRPIFGSSFYLLNDLAEQTSAGWSWIWSDVDAFTAFFPGRWHNTAIQLLACGGIVALVAYAFHRYQTLRLFFQKPNAEKCFIGFSLAVLLLLSLLDCHFFNIGPVLFYSSALTFAENKAPDDPEGE